MHTCARVYRCAHTPIYARTPIRAHTDMYINIHICVQTADTYIVHTGITTSSRQLTLGFLLRWWSNSGNILFFPLLPGWDLISCWSYQRVLSCVLFARWSSGLIIIILIQYDQLVGWNYGSKKITKYIPTRQFSPFNENLYTLFVNLTFMLYVCHISVLAVDSTEHNVNSTKINTHNTIGL